MYTPEGNTMSIYCARARAASFSKIKYPISFFSASLNHTLAFKSPSMVCVGAPSALAMLKFVTLFSHFVLRAVCHT